ncbi:MAG: hypothetical protein ACK5M7_10730 [Draconibacterium sp.]
MKIFRKILVVLLAVIFLISSSGYVLYSSTCSCSGEKYTSVFVRPDTCETSFHKHHKHGTEGIEQACSAGECHDCNASENLHDKCGCDSPEIFFFKLKDKANNDDVKFMPAAMPYIQVFTGEIPDELLSDSEAVKSEFEIHSPPDKVITSFDFLISIQQIKIPSLA